MSSSERYKLTVAELEALPAGHVLKLASSGELWAKEIKYWHSFRRVKDGMMLDDFGQSEKGLKGMSLLWLLPCEQPAAPLKSYRGEKAGSEDHRKAAESATAGLSTATLTALADAGGVKRVLELLAKYHWYHVDCEEYMENHDPPTWVRDTGNILREMTELADTALLGKETQEDATLHL